MTRHSQRPWTYRDDPAVPSFDDSRPLFIFDGHCALCSRGVRWLMAADRRGRVAFTSAQGALGTALYRHFGVDVDSTYLVIDQGHAYGMSGGYLRLLRHLGGGWQALRILGIFPEALRDAGYRWVARNRYRWFGRYGHCELLTEEERRRLI